MVFIHVGVYLITMDKHTPNTDFNNAMLRFREIADNIVNKYCSMPLPYKPGLYSIYWESTCRITGLMSELQTAADQELKTLKTDTRRAAQDFDEAITQSLIKYTEKIFNAEYPNSEQPDWMIEIAHRLIREIGIAY